MLRNTSRLVILLGLIVCTLFSVLMMGGALREHDPESRWWGAALGGAGVAFFVPFLATFCRKAPLLVLLPFVALIVAGVVGFNAWFESVLGGFPLTLKSFACWPLACFSLPGLAVLMVRWPTAVVGGNRESEHSPPASEDVWPPPPRPPL